MGCYDVVARSCAVCDQNHTTTCSMYAERNESGPLLSGEMLLARFFFVKVFRVHIGALAIGHASSFWDDKALRLIVITRTQHISVCITCLPTLSQLCLSFLAAEAFFNQLLHPRRLLLIACMCGSNEHSTYVYKQCVGCCPNYHWLWWASEPRQKNWNTASTFPTCHICSMFNLPNKPDVPMDERTKSLLWGCF